jgi:hypothetical protein
MSDMTTGDGAFIDCYAQQGRQNNTRKDRYLWPMQGPPNTDDWATWKKGLLLLGHQEWNGTLKLYQSLGPWMRCDDAEWFFDSSSERILQSSSGRLYTRQGGRPSRQAHSRFKLCGSADDTFQNTHTITVVEKRNNCIDMEGKEQIIKRLSPQYDTFRDFVRDKPKWAWWATQLIYKEEDINKIIQDQEKGDGIAVSDGSYKDGHGTAAIVLEGTQEGKRITTEVMVPARTEEQCAYQSEAAGILTAIQLIDAISQFFRCSTGRCIIGCDGQSALQQCLYQRSDSQVNCPHFDIVSEARRAREGLCIQLIPKYIPGHQTENLDREARLNNEMDMRCKQFWDRTSNMRLVWFHSPIFVQIEGERIGDLS